jgi:hypothetical protein
MKGIFKSIICLSLVACGDSQPEPLYLTKDFYNWTCSDYENHSTITVTTVTCEDHESGLYWLIAESHLVAGGGFKRKLDKTSNWDIDCVYQTELPLIDDYCIEVDGVTLTAYVEPATWSGALFGD